MTAEAPAEKRNRQLMIRNRRTFFRHIAAALVLAAATLGTAPARADAGFQNWINEFYTTAAKAGISKSTYRQAFAGVKSPDQTVIASAAVEARLPLPWTIASYASRVRSQRRSRSMA